MSQTAGEEVMIVFDLMVFKFESHVPSTLLCKLKKKPKHCHLSKRSQKQDTFDSTRTNELIRKVYAPKTITWDQDC